MGLHSALLKGSHTATLPVPCRDHTSFLFGMCDVYDASSPYPAFDIFVSAALALQAFSNV